MPGRGREAQSFRRVLHEGPLGRVEEFCCPGHVREQGAEEYSADHQFVLPASGAFLWHVGGEEVFADVNQVIYITGDESYRISHPVCGGDQCVIITPAPSALEELTTRPLQAVRALEPFRHRARAARPVEQLHAAQLRNPWRTEPLGFEEMLVALVRSLLNRPRTHRTPTPAARRTIRQAKQILQSGLHERLSLAEVARCVGLSPIYLTTLFTRIEGISLHRYHMRLRLASALARLQQACDLGALGLELGFSSHSHFSAAFRQAFGLTPSAMREAACASRPMK
jgi:AraC-like DNA-binding protein